MAKTKYKVTTGDTFASLAKKAGTSPQTLMNLNKGVPKLSTGQQIFLPKAIEVGGAGSPFGGVRGSVAPVSSGYQNNLSYVNNNGTVGFQTPTFGTGNTIGLPKVQPYNGQGVVTGAQGSLMAGQQPYAPAAAPLGANSFTSGGQVNTQTGMQNLLGTSYATGQAQPTVGGDSSGQAWVDYWNNAAAGVSTPRPTGIYTGGGGSGGYIPTKSDIWNMKADARRRQQQDTPVKRAPIPRGNAVNTSLTWRVG